MIQFKKIQLVLFNLIPLFKDMIQNLINFIQFNLFMLFIYC